MQKNDRNKENEMVLLPWVEYYANCHIATFPVAGKAPALSGNWRELSTDNVDQATALFLQAGSRATGIANDSGKSSLVVIDADKHESVDGPANLDRLAAEYGIDLSQVCCQQTGGGGLQYFFKDPLGLFSNSTNRELSIDVRGVGGYVVLPPSIHPNGQRYKWLRDPSKYPITEVTPDVIRLIEFIQAKKIAENPAAVSAQVDAGELILSSGERNDKVFRMACRERSQGKGYEAILASLRGFNKAQVRPPLSDREIQTIARQAAKYPIDEASAAADFAPTPGEPILINLEEIEPEEVEWLSYPYLPKKKIITFQGDPGGKKTYLTIHSAARVTRGEPPLGDGMYDPEPGMVLYQNGEDGLADTIVPRLIACGADLTKIRMINEEKRALTLDNIPLIEAAFKECRPKLFIIDPIQQYLGADKDMHRANEVRPVLSRIAKLCEEYGTACIIVMHMNKGDGKAMYRALGSIDFAAIARSQLLIGRNRNNPAESLIVHTKSSLAPAGASMAFRIKDEGGIEMLGISTATEDDILKEAPAVKEDSTMAEAMRVIRDAVAVAPVWNADLEEKALEKGMSIRTLNRAKEALIDCGEIQRCKAPGLQKWFIKRRGAEVIYRDAAPAYGDLT